MVGVEGAEERERRRKTDTMVVTGKLLGDKGREGSEEKIILLPCLNGT